MINQGNPNLKPERSTSFDAGMEWVSATTHVDVTYYYEKKGYPLAGTAITLKYRLGL